MKIKLLCGLVLALLLNSTAYAFSSDEERIDHYLNILNSGHSASQETMLSRLKWSGLSDPRLFDEIERRLLQHYQGPDMSLMGLMAHHVRALGYSGNKKYRSTITKVYEDGAHGRLRKHAKKALRDLNLYSNWNRLVQNSSLDTSGKSVEVGTYLKMLHADDVYVNRLAARAMFDEKLTDKDLIDAAAKKLRGMYMQEGLKAQEQDTAAWLCKAIAISKDAEHETLLREVGQDSPYKKIRKYARKYATN